MASRFSAFSDPRNDLRDSDRVIRYARELFDDEQPRRAIELIRIAIEEDQSQRAAAGARSAFCCAAMRVSGGELPANERSHHVAFFIRFLKARWNKKYQSTFLKSEWRDSEAKRPWNRSSKSVLA